MMIAGPVRTHFRARLLGGNGFPDLDLPYVGSAKRSIRPGLPCAPRDPWNRVSPQRADPVQQRFAVSASRSAPENQRTPRCIASMRTAKLSFTAVTRVGKDRTLPN